MSMIASGKISFAADHAVNNIEDIALHLKYHNESIEPVKLEDGQVIYIHRGQTSTLQSPPSHKIMIGPLEINITIDTSARTIVAQIFINVPIIGHILLSSATGAYDSDKDVEFEFKIAAKGVASGVAGVKWDATTKDVILFWDFTALGKELKGSHNLFHI